MKSCPTWGRNADLLITNVLGTWVGPRGKPADGKPGETGEGPRFQGAATRRHCEFQSSRYSQGHSESSLTRVTRLVADTESQSLVTGAR